MKYFKPYLLFLQEDENYGGFKETLNKFQDLIFETLKKDEVLGENGTSKRLQI